MFKDQFHISKLITGHLQGNLNDEQQAELNAWISASESNKIFLEEFYNEQQINDDLKKYNSLNEDAVWNKTISKIQEKPIVKDIPVKTLHGFTYKVVAAAAILLVFGAGLLFYTSRHPDADQDPGHAIYANDIKPGGNKAILILANGQKISLTDATNGTLVNQAGISITKTKEGQLVYAVSAKNNADRPIEYNTAETPKGGQYLLNLSDGTKIWLNAASSLKYPTQFKGKNRVVELTGEAYFEVAHNKNKPFKVISRRQEVEVLGTHFNINAYANEPVIKTTLLEGSVKVATLNSLVNSKAGILKQIQDDVVLRPGQQSINTGTGINIAQVDTENVIDWKNGDFVFNGEDFKSVMRKIARWYDIEVIYDASVPENIAPGGWISRNNKISAVLKVIESTGQVHFKIEGRRLTVTK